jgi:hypothetical protein
MRNIILAGALLVLAGSAMTAAAADGTRIEMQLLDHGRPVVGAQIAIFLSCDKLEGTTGDNGRLVLESSSCHGGYYWVEIDGKRVDTLYQVERDARTLDLADVSFMNTPGGR